MARIPNWPPPRRLLPILLALFMGCTGGGTESPSLDEGLQSNAQAAPKGGLDGPAVAAGPFLDGAFPSRTPNAPGSAQWTITSAFSNLTLANAMAIATNPVDERLYVGSREGLVVAFDNRSEVSATETFLDLSDRVVAGHEGGLLALVFHPEFGNATSPHARSLYAYYTSDCPLDSSRDAPDLSACGTSGMYARLSRFEVFDGTVTGDPSSEQVLFNVSHFTVHLGGGMVFRDDAYLYLAVGDGTNYETAQDIASNLEGGVLRVSVDVIDNGDGTWTCPTGSHLPRRIYDTAGEVSGQHYCIPDDNPWLDLNGGVFEEYCALGMRNPYRLAHDPTTDRLWQGDVGEETREEINIVECGNNYGWPFREGLIPGPRTEPQSFLGVLTDPVIDFPRGEASSIIGGYVYRGARLPELYGRYLAGDFVTNRVWAITLDELTMTATKDYLANFPAGSLTTWGQDKQGEVFLGSSIGFNTLYALERVSQPVSDPPPLLSQTGAFSDLAGAVPSAVWIPYALNQPFWSDGALKFRFAAVPNDGLRDTAGEQVAFSSSGDWTYPTGTVLMKHFELLLDEGDPTSVTRLETRFLVLGDDGLWYGLTYRWRADQMEADLLIADQSADYTIELSGGGSRTQSWYFPSRLDCLSCHRQTFGGAAGPRTHQLNGDFHYASTGRTDNQLRTWNDLGMFSPPLVDSSIPTLLKSPALGDVTASLQDRARSWLDSNCSYCHRPGGANAGFDARFTTAFVDQQLIGTPVRNDLGNPGTVVVYPGDPVLSALWQRAAAIGPVAMPPLAKALIEQPGVDLLGEWIERLKPLGMANVAPVLGTPGDQSNQGETVALSLNAADADGDSLYFDATGLPDGLVLDHESGEISGTPVSSGTHSVTASASDGAEVSVVSFEWLVEIAVCGDGVEDSGEDCDDGNLADGDGCTSSCKLEFCGDGLVNNGGTETCEPPGTALCADSCTARTPSCGDGFQTPPEACEDENLIDGDGCTSSCTLEFCGDGLVNNGGTEACEPPGTAICTDTCAERIALCGDGFVTPPETCEDGNLVDGDGCTSGCALELCGDGVINNGGAETCEPPGTAVCNDSCTARIALCGDGFETPPEPCEDGNLIDGDGCTRSCMLEFCGDGLVNNAGAEACEPPGTALCTATCALREPLCGDELQTPPEACEDGNLIDGDGCTSTCTLEFCGDGLVNNAGTEACEPPGTGVCTDSCAARVAQCGDDFLTPPEACEDGNLMDGDGCSSACTVEVPPSCGDGVSDPGEDCDDGNLMDGDGCTSRCTRELCGDGIVNNGGMEACEPPGTALCTDTCSMRSADCGDGFMTPPEACEDGNLIDGDGCTSSCMLEFCGDGVINDIGAETCEPPGTMVCNESCTDRATLCGDGFVTPPETCEDGNLVDGDGCTSSCALEFCGDGAVNNEGLETCEPPGTTVCSESCVLRVARCGDGFFTAPEECEDGNLVNGDGCTSSCMREVCGDGIVNDSGAEGCEPPGTALCTDTCSMRSADCGDGFMTPPEQCEDGNLVDGDGCTAGCMLEFCGDGVVNNSGTEDCEPPGTSLCDDSCTSRLVFCGDGMIDAGEDCDDGNTVDGDGCSAICVLESSPMPDGGVLMPDGGVLMPDGGVPMPGEGDPLIDEPSADITGGGSRGCTVRRNAAPFDFGALLGAFALLWVRRRPRRA